MRKKNIIGVFFLGILCGICLILGYNYLTKQDVLETVQPYALTENQMDAIRNSESYQEVFENKDLYPARMLEDLERNPEMLEFVVNYPNAEPVVSGGISAEEAKEKCPLFIQWDARWGYTGYGMSNIGLSGCGPTCLSMVVYSFTRDASITPDVIADYSMKEGYYVKNAGTSWQLLEDVAFRYGLSVEVMDNMDEKEIRKALKQDGLIICSVGPGDFTDQGHFIVIRDYNSEGYFVNDPFSYTNSAKVWDYDTLIKQVVKMWVYRYYD